MEIQSYTFSTNRRLTALPSTVDLVWSTLPSHDEDVKSDAQRIAKERMLVPKISPTAACIPVTFEPNYCDFDRFYFLGVGLVTAAIGMFSSSAVVSLGVFSRMIQNALAPNGNSWLRYEESTSGGFFDALLRAFDRSLMAAEMPLLKSENRQAARVVPNLTPTQLREGLENIPPAQRLQQLESAMASPATYVADVTADSFHLVQAVVAMILSPALAALPAGLGAEGGGTTVGSLGATATLYAMIVGGVGASTQTAKHVFGYIARNMNVTARGLGSFFRYNYALYENGEPLDTQLKRYFDDIKRDQDQQMDYQKRSRLPPAYDQRQPASPARQRFANNQGIPGFR